MDTTLNPILGCSTWSTVVGGTICRSPPPVPACQVGGVSELELYNSFAPLADLPTSPTLWWSGIHKRSDDQGQTLCFSKGGLSSPGAGALPPSAADANVVSLFSPCQPPQMSMADTVLPVGTSSPSRNCSTVLTYLTVLDGLCPPGLSDSLSVAPLPTTSSNHANSDNTDGLQLPPHTTIHFNSDIQCNPEILIVGDSIVKDLIIPNAITYCVPGGKVIDISKLIPSLLGRHPSVNIVIAHVGTNDIMARSSIKLQDELETLCLTIESYGKRCIMSGPIPFSSSHSERFSRLYSLHG